ncbi:3-hydroxyisobutyrate dehydrogenase [Pandoraea eparura]|uniref:3-hydroxyisobutyrate dehydrogenase n=1 Tax=Pandoraea eparura TaxID=2508291 RepID=A0A5E4U3T7_9BURK|nr:NAD(P)-dependent oxidoreductase [Pandoraea eparura]VVD94745.1 3-hydroxyisobutyrate dehydrogenase [Pandoraea eparura]
MSADGFNKVAFIGIGNMGWPMAARLVEAGFHLSVYDVTPDRAKTFSSDVGGVAAETLEHAVAGANAVITMLPTSKHVVEALESVRSSLSVGALVIDMTSGMPSITKDAASSLRADGICMIDAPVSGGVSKAKTGELAIMTGGAPEDLARARPLLQAMGTAITEVGSIGAGQAMKALNNLVSAGGFLIGIEALLIGQKFGLDAGKMVDVINASTGVNNSTQKKFRQFVLSRAFDSNFGLDLMVKDIGIALEVANEGGVVTPFSALCRELWSGAAKTLGHGRDHTEIARFCEALTDMRLGEDSIQ